MQEPPVTASVEINNLVDNEIIDASVQIGLSLSYFGDVSFPHNFGLVSGGNVSVTIEGYTAPNGNSLIDLVPFYWSGTHDFDTGPLVLNRLSCYPAGYDVSGSAAPFDIASCISLRADGSLWYKSESGLDSEGNTVQTGIYYVVCSSEVSTDNSPGTNTVGAMSTYDSEAPYSGRHILFVDGVMPAGYTIAFQHTWLLPPDENWYNMSTKYSVWTKAEFFADSDVWSGTTVFSGDVDDLTGRVFFSWWLDDTRYYRFALNTPAGCYSLSCTDDVASDYLLHFPLPFDDEYQEGDDYYDLVPITDFDGEFLFDGGDFADDPEYSIDPPGEDTINPDPIVTPGDPGNDPSLPESDVEEGLSQYFLEQIANNTWRTEETLLDSQIIDSESLNQDLRQSGYLSALYEQSLYQSQQLLSLNSGFSSGGSDADYTDVLSGMNSTLDSMLSSQTANETAVTAAHQILDAMNQRHEENTTRDTAYQVAQQAWAATVLGHYDNVEDAFTAQGLILSDTGANVADMLLQVSDMNSAVLNSSVQLAAQTSELEEQTDYLTQIPGAVRSGNVVLTNLSNEAERHTSQFTAMNQSLSNLVAKQWAVTNNISVPVNVSLTNSTDVSGVEDLLTELRDSLPGGEVSIDPYEENSEPFESVDVEGARESFEAMKLRWDTFFSETVVPVFPSGLGSVSGVSCSFHGYPVAITWDRPEFESIRELLRWFVGILTFVGALVIIRKGIA